MLDIKLIRENPELVKSNIEKRGNPANIIMFEDLIATDKIWRQNLTKLNDLRHDRKVCTAEIANLKKTGKNADLQVQKAKAVDAEITSLEKEVTKE
jgi:seryl-tRNA synthetase